MVIVNPELHAGSRRDLGELRSDSRRIAKVVQRHAAGCTTSDKLDGNLAFGQVAYKSALRRIPTRPANSARRGEFLHASTVRPVLAEIGRLSG